MDHSIRLLVVARYPVVEVGLETLLRDAPDITITTTSASGTEGMEWLRKGAVDVAVIDDSLLETELTETIRLYLDENPRLGILVFSSKNDEAFVYDVLSAGARGYLLKSAPTSQLTEGIREVHRGGYALSPSLSPNIIRFYLKNRSRQQADPLAHYETLTKREKQVFRLLALGKQTQDIANLLYISPKTVSKHRVAVKKKLAMTTVVEMTKYALQLGLIDIAEISPGQQQPSPEPVLDHAAETERLSCKS